MTPYIYPPGQRIILEDSELTFEKSNEVCIAAKNHSFCQVIEVGKIQENNAEFIVIEIDIERGQISVNPIEFKERVLVEIKSDSIIPYVYALRSDFPLLPHENLMEFDFPKCLCLYEQPWEEIAIQWTGFSFLERIRQWLSLSAAGILHQEDQALEPFLINTLGSIILEKNIINGESLSIKLRAKSDNHLSFIVATDEDIINKKVDYYSLCFESSIQVHGIVNKQPENLSDLAILLEKCDIKLLDKLKDLAFIPESFKKYLILLLSIPIKRYQNSEVVKIENFAFLCHNTIEEIGLELNILGKHAGVVSPLIGTSITHEKLINAKIGILNIYYKFNKTIASNLAKISNDFKITQIGLGAMGSSIFNSLSRSGFGTHWTLVDNDVLLPHNLYRHSLFSFQVGEFKASAVSFMSNYNLGDMGFSTSYVERFSKTMTDELKLKILESDLILDTSASLSVSRILADMNEILARKLSIFLNPRGDTLVVLAEDKGKTINLTELEMLYYKGIKGETALEFHFQDNSNRVRYGNSCRDISNFIPNEYNGIFSSIASHILKNINSKDNAFIKLWSLQGDLSVNRFEFPVSKFIRQSINDWEVCINQTLIDNIFNERIQALPNETGGILIGSYDTNYKKVYIVDSIYSPNDSKSYPEAYYRGIEGVSEKLSTIEKITNGFLTYIGEWHSHPNRCSVSQSSDDIKLFTWIKNFMNSNGLPGVMLIAGEEKLGLYLD